MIPKDLYIDPILKNMHAIIQNIQSAEQIGKQNTSTNNNKNKFD
jgi:hypothetical protein